MLEIEKNYMIKAKKYAEENSTCPRTKVGAIIINHNKIISYGANRTHYSVPNCNSIKCPKLEPEYAYALWDGIEICRGVHAEWDAILKANRDDLIGATLYATHEPCFICTRIILQSGITEIVYQKEFDTQPIKLRNRLIQDSGLIVRKINSENE